MKSVQLAGRVTRDLETRTVGSGTKIAKFGFAVSGQKKDAATGNYVDDPMFIDVKCFNQTVDRIEKLGIGKGAFLVIEGDLSLETWDDKQTGQKRSRHVVIMNRFTLGPKVDGNNAPRQQAAPGPTAGQQHYDNSPQSSGDDIPF